MVQFKRSANSPTCPQAYPSRGENQQASDVPSQFSVIVTWMATPQPMASQSGTADDGVPAGPHVPTPNAWFPTCKPMACLEPQGRTTGASGYDPGIASVNPQDWQAMILGTSPGIAATRRLRTNSESEVVRIFLVAPERGYQLPRAVTPGGCGNILHDASGSHLAGFRLLIATDD